MFRPIQITPPAESPITLEELKAYAIVDADFKDDDTLLTSLRDAAVAYLDGFRGVLGRAMVTQTWQVSQPTWLPAFVLPVPDVTEVAISYLDADGVAQDVLPGQISTIDVAAGTMVTLSQDFAFPALLRGGLPPISVKFTCGFGGADDVPENLKVAIEALAANWYHNRNGSEKEGIPLGVQALINPYRWGPF